MSLRYNPGSILWCWRERYRICQNMSTRYLLTTCLCLFRDFPPLSVIALDTSPTRLALARHNAQIYGVADRIEFILGDYLQFAESYSSREGMVRKIDVVFLSPPWGGPSYLTASSRPASPVKPSAEATKEDEEHPSFPLSAIQPIHGAELFQLSRRISKSIAYYLPRNVDLDEVSALLSSDEKEKIEVEEEWMGGKLKAVTCYFGGLVEGQGDMFASDT